MRLKALGLVLFFLFLGAVSADVSTDSGALTSIDVFVADPADIWTGVYGQVSGSQAVGSTNPLYEWDSGEARYIYFSQNQIDFQTDWEAGNISMMEENYPFIVNSTADANKTFNSSMQVDSIYHSQVLDVPAVYTKNSSGSSVWGTGYISDGSNGFFAGEVREGAGFDGSDINYQVMLPENGNDGSPSSYQVWVELAED
ncbi:MAG: hypothetical protein ACI8Z7_000325 [Candidatus Nanohaloarchaea archaeon]|jgi:hypothetical protein